MSMTSGEQVLFLACARRPRLPALLSHVGAANTSAGRRDGPWPRPLSGTPRPRPPVDVHVWLQRIPHAAASPRAREHRRETFRRSTEDRPDRITPRTGAEGPSTPRNKRGRRPAGRVQQATPPRGEEDPRQFCVVARGEGRNVAALRPRFTSPPFPPASPGTGWPRGKRPYRALDVFTATRGPRRTPQAAPPLPQRRRGGRFRPRGGPPTTPRLGRSMRRMARSP